MERSRKEANNQSRKEGRQVVRNKNTKRVVMREMRESRQDKTTRRGSCIAHVGAVRNQDVGSPQRRTLAQKFAQNTRLDAASALRIFLGCNCNPAGSASRPIWIFQDLARDRRVCKWQALPPPPPSPQLGIFCKRHLCRLCCTTAVLCAFFILILYLLI